MLVLSRKIGEKIKIRTANGETVEIAILDVRGSRSKLGFTSSPGVRIDRTEVLERMKQPVEQPGG